MNAPATHEALARTLVDALGKRAFADVVAGFDDTMRGALPASKLEQVWDATLASAGALKACKGTTSSVQAGYQVVVLSCEFERAPLDIRVVFDGERRVAGLFFKPPARAYALPAYAKTDAFDEEDVTVGAAPWTLPGTLALPKGKSKSAAVVLVHGSGPNDRDETVGANKPFKDLAAGLASRGVAVLRYEKRTRVYGAKMAALTALTVNEESVDDAVAAAELLRGRPEIDPDRVFVAGHSLGGELVPRIGKRDPRIAGLIVLAGSTRPLGPVMLEQMKYIFAQAGGTSPEQQRKLDEVASAWTRIVEIQKGKKADPKEMLLGAPPSYWVDLAGYDAPRLAQTLSRPMLVVQGGRDYQVTQEDFERWRAALGSKKDVTLKLYPALNHLLARGEGKSTPAEYERETHVDEEVVRDLAGWIDAHGKR